MRAPALVLAGLACAFACAFACASTPSKPAVRRLSTFRVPAQTGVDLLLRNTVDLSLTTPQVAELVKIQAALNEKVKPIHEEMDAARFGRPPPPGEPPAGAQGTAPPAPPPPPPPYPPYGPGRWVGATRASGDIGPPLTGRPREAKEPVPPDYEQRRAKLEALIKQYDEEDQAAYARAEALLDESQKAVARKLMSARAAERARPQE
jgi:hypothetical protein